jgi:alkyldihydroxyacetonephosphate synthase
MSFDQNRICWNGWGPRDDALSESQWAWLAEALAMPALLATPPRALEDITLPTPRLAAAVWNQFRIFGEVRQDDLARARHAAGRGLADLLRLRAGDLSQAPDAVLYPKDEDAVLALLKLCAELDIAVVPFGGGTSLVGGVTPLRGKHAAIVTLDMSAMARLTLVDALSGLAQAQAGISGPELERQLAAHGLMLGHFPGSFEFSTLGGWIAHHGAGQEAARYGRAGDWLQGVRLATPTGLLAAGGARATGPDLRAIALGSEGVFGVITAATLKVHPIAAKEAHRSYLFPNFAAGLAAMREAAQAGLPHTMLRLSDAAETGFGRALARAGRLFDLKARLADIYLEIRRFDARAVTLTAGFDTAGARKRFDALAKKHGALARGEDKDWPARRFAFGYRRDTLLDRGLGVDMVDTSTSWSKLPDLHAAVCNALDHAMRRNAPRPGAHGLVLAHVGHDRHDGASVNFTYLFPRLLDGEIAQAAAIKQAALAAIAAQGATLSHAHGVGTEHLPWMEQEKGAVGIEVLRGIKRALDPRGVMNPGKLIA